VARSELFQGYAPYGRRPENANKENVMGLDQYGYAADASKAEAGEDADERPGYEELAYWRKHPNLQGWMEGLWRSRFDKGETHNDTLMSHPEGDFNCEEVELTEEDLFLLEADINSGGLPTTSGFFFGDSDDGYYKETDLKFIVDARRALSEGKRIFYSSWW
jgi:hypothetical protein